jgi:hypothetical protein
VKNAPGKLKIAARDGEKFRPCLKEKTPGIDRAFSLITRRRRCGAAGNPYRVAALFVGRLSTLYRPSSQSEVNGGFQFTAIVRLGTPNDESSGAIAVIHKKRSP